MIISKIIELTNKICFLKFFKNNNIKKIDTKKLIKADLSPVIKIDKNRNANKSIKIKLFS